MKLINQATEEKLRGGFYTPPSIASFILKWGFNGSKSHDVLEPSCGDGVFLEEIKKAGCSYKSIDAIELDTEEAAKAKAIRTSKTKVVCKDFHVFCNETEKKYDLVVGNPPYIRYQYFDKQQRNEAEEIFRRANLKYSKLTNAWVSFVVGSSLLLKDSGKIGFVLPAEILQVSYAKTLRQFLAHFYNKINIISFKKLVFPDIQQEVVLLLCEKNNSKTHCIEHLELNDAGDLATLDMTKLRSPRKKIDFKSNKWTFYFLNQKEIDFLEKLQEQKTVPILGDYATVEVGITTGANPFFTVPLSTVNNYNMKSYAKPLVGRSVQVPSAIFTTSDWELNRDNEAKAHLLVFPPKDKLQKNKAAMEYLDLGRQQGIDRGYKCKIRDEWQIVPSLRISDALFIRRNNIYPKLIINEANAYTTDTMHRVTPRADVNIKALTASYYNSLSLAFAEICGRSHGGGVLELMPNEVEEIMLPYHPDNEALLDSIDRMIREETPIEEILEFTNKKILKEHYGFTSKEISLANNIWKKLSKRRLTRGKKDL
jgi:adenine-specific DNA methylase